MCSSIHATLKKCFLICCWVCFLLSRVHEWRGWEGEVGKSCISISRNIWISILDCCQHEHHVLLWFFNLVGRHYENIYTSIYYQGLYSRKPQVSINRLCNNLLSVYVWVCFFFSTFQLMILLHNTNKICFGCLFVPLCWSCDKSATVSALRQVHS